ncbi:DUF6503 family protein [Spongiivirga sp. MCCC 1A20706]|uniref:DUF6503 family protein n=1 Tax=Spongiivirga sp. MCCC 1A20706 TaxID=3160963 RepID=UPI00397764F5
MLKKSIYYLLLVFTCQNLFAQELTADELLDKAIFYHDPNGNWKNFQSILHINLEMPDSPNRKSEVYINLPKNVFGLKTVQDTITTYRKFEKGKCSFSLNGKTALDSTEIKKHRGDCERTKMYRNYYTYLYGLPMKLKDAGTIIHKKVQKRTFKGKDYLVIKVTYDEYVGTDTWYFYFDPTTYAMKVYQFYKNEAKNDGEYILLTDELITNGIKLPKTRAWYYNKNDGYLGTDQLEKTVEIDK